MKRETETLYRKVGRRYVPAYSLDDWPMYGKDAMPVGTLRLTHAAGCGSYRYEYDVTPDTAGWRAAAMIARGAMADAITAASHATPTGVVRYTKKQLEVLETAKQMMRDAGCLLPSMWTHQSAHQIADAGIDAVTQWAEHNKGTK